MTCKQCSNEITSAITGELCTACYFKSRRKDNGPVITTSDSSSESSNIESGQQDDDSGEKIKREKVKIKEAPNDGKKYCQSCIERYGNLVLATREWQPNYFICDDCFQPLIHNVLDINEHELSKLIDSPKIDESKPLLNQFYDIMNLPKELRFQTSDAVLNARNDIFTYHAPALINKPVEEVANDIEELRVMLFQIKVAIENKAQYVADLKNKLREENHVKSIDKARKESSKSKVGTSQEQKLADALFKLVSDDPKVRLQKLMEMKKEAQKKEFDKKVGS